MLKVGDRVFPIHNMGNTGVIVEQAFVESKRWIVGGVPSKERRLTVQHDDGTMKVYTSDELMRS